MMLRHLDKEGLSMEGQVERLLDDYVDRRLDRAELLRRVVALGVSASAVGALLDAVDGERALAASAGGTKSFRIAPYSRAQPDSFDPAQSGNGFWSGEMDGIFEGLIGYKPGPRWEAVNVLAEKLEVSSDGKRFAFTLKKGVQFHHGFGEVTADDVKYSYERIAGIQKLYPNAGSKDVSLYASNWQELERVKVTGKYTGVIMLKKPDATVLSTNLPFYSTGLVVSKKAIEKYGKHGAATNPVGTGPYQLPHSYTPGKPYSYTRFPGWGNHWNRPTYWDEIFWDVAPLAPGQSTTIPLEAGESDFDAFPTLQDLNRLKGNHNIRAAVAPTLTLRFLGMNVQYPGLQDIRVRQAIRYTVDVPAILKLEGVSPSDQAFSPLAPGFGKTFQWKGAPHYQRDVAKARALMAAAGASSLSFDLADGLTSPPTPGVAEIVQSNLADIGIKATILTRATTPSNWWTDPKVTQLTLSDTGGAPDPTSQLIYYRCDHIGNYNPAQWCNKTYDGLYDTLLTSHVNSRRGAAAIQMQKLIDASAANVWIDYANYYYLSSRHVIVTYDPAGNYYPTQFKPGV